MEIVFEIGDTSAERIRAHAAEVDVLIRDALTEITYYAEAQAKDRAGFRTGNLRRNIVTIPATKSLGSTADEYQSVVGVSRSAPYAIWTHEGTGNFGEFHRPIRSHAGNVLRFRVLGGGVLFRRSVKGQRANPFMRDAFQATIGTFAPLRIDKLARDIAQL